MKKKLFTLILLSGLLVTGCNNKESNTTEVATTTDATTTDATEEVIEEPEFDSVSVYQTTVTRDDGKGESYDVSVTITGSNCTVYVDDNTYNFVLANNTYTSEEDCVFGGVNYGKTFTLINKSDNRYLLSYLDTEDFEYLVVGEVAIEEESVTTEESAEATVNSGAGNKPKPSTNNKPSTNTKPSANTKPSNSNKPSTDTKPSSDTKPSTSNSNKPGTSTASGNTGNTSQTVPQTTPQTTTPNENYNVTTEEYVSAVTPGTKPETTEPEECIHDYKKVIAQEAWDEEVTKQRWTGETKIYCPACGQTFPSDQACVAHYSSCPNDSVDTGCGHEKIYENYTEIVHHDATYYYQCSKCGLIKY